MNYQRKNPSHELFFFHVGFIPANVIPFCFTRDIIPAAPLLINVTTINRRSRGWDKYLRLGYLSLFAAGLFAANFPGICPKYISFVCFP